MKRIFWLVLCVAGSAALGAQSSTPQGLISRPEQRILADRIERVGATSSWHLRGHVMIVDPASTVSADEVDVETGSNGVMQLDLRGNVHMTMTMNPTR